MFSAQMLMTWVLLFGFISCNHQTKQNSITPETPLAGKAAPAIAFDQSITDAARFVAGMKVDKESSFYALTQTPEWKNYALTCDTSWNRFNHNIAADIKQWANAEIPADKRALKTVFYPFSGPDFLNANIYFPNAEEYIMFGLEPHGSIPDPEKVASENMTAYLNAYSNTINSVVNQSFFHTKKMAVNFKTKALDGTTPILLLFLARANKKIISVKPFRFSETGSLNYLPEFATYTGEKGYGSGVEIMFCDSVQDKAKKIIYFSANIADGGLGNDLPTRKFLETIQPHCATFVKSATYLMHKSYFSIIRNTVLKNSDLILQDDSGIKYSFFDPAKWNIQLYGSYNKPIQLFAEHYEPDLYKAYQNGSVKKLPFRSGYNSVSNMLMAERK